MKKEKYWFRICDFGFRIEYLNHVETKETKF